MFSLSFSSIDQQVAGGFAVIGPRHASANWDIRPVPGVRVRARVL